MKAIVVIDLPDDFDINTTCVAMDIVDKNDNWTTTAAKVRPIPSEYCVFNKDDQYDNERYYYGYNKAIRDCVGDENIEY